MQYAPASRTFQGSNDFTGRHQQFDKTPEIVANVITDNNSMLHQKTAITVNETLTPPKQTPSTTMSGTVSSASSSTSSKKKRRVLFSKEQITDLENNFRRHSYLSSVERDQLAAALHLTPTQIKIWFQNHRYKLKKLRQDESITATSSPSPVNGMVVAGRHHDNRLQHRQQHHSPVNEQIHHPTTILAGFSTATTTSLNGWSMASDQPSTTTFQNFHSRPYGVGVSVVPSSTTTLFSHPASRHFGTMPPNQHASDMHGSFYQIDGYGAADPVTASNTDTDQPPMMSSFVTNRAGGFLSSHQDGGVGIGIEAATKLMLLQHH